VVQIERQVRNIRYIAELTKFNLVPANVALEYLKTLLDNFIGNNLDLISNFLETCGPFLVNSKDEAV
jgi:regulator of nonsense transcripts 2